MSVKACEKRSRPSSVTRFSPGAASRPATLVNIHKLQLQDSVVCAAKYGVLCCTGGSVFMWRAKAMWRGCGSVPPSRDGDLNPLVNDKEPPDRPLRHWTYTFFGIIRLNIMSLTHGNAFENSAYDDFELWGSKRARTRVCVRSADPKPKGRSIMAVLAHGTTDRQDEDHNGPGLTIHGAMHRLHSQRVELATGKKCLFYLVDWDESDGVSSSLWKLIDDPSPRWRNGVETTFVSSVVPALVGGYIGVSNLNIPTTV
ncbi:hypothetical protein F5I97DRAFT_1832962 [Phlebopus sp. FC_14]|nr:hypothetical protein F5I97DRAFT_1832962 [Phlebopus sp. FC_14]